MRVLHGQSVIALAAKDQLVFGRLTGDGLDLQLPADDNTVSRRAGRFWFGEAGWAVQNIGRRPLFVVQQGEERELLPGAPADSSIYLLGSEPWIRLPTTAGDMAVLLEIPEQEQTVLTAIDVRQSMDGTAIEQPVELTENERRSVVAVYEGYLHLPPTYRREPNSFRASAHRIRAEEGKVKADLRRVQDKVAKAGGPATGGSRYRDALIAWLISRNVVTRDDLWLLDADQSR